MELPKLYGYASNGSVKEWSIWTEGDSFVVSHGKLGGKLQYKITQCKPKNVGRANETTAEDQAIKEAKAKWQKQLDKNYAERIEDAGQLLNPMLAYDYRKQGHRIVYPAYAQPKLDGVRCLIYQINERTVFMSRGGKEYPVIDEIADELQPLFDEQPELVLDGELYIHGESLQTIVSAVKKHNFNTHKVEFWVFDIASGGGDWTERRDRVEIMPLKHPFTKVFFVKDTLVNSEEELKQYHWEYVQDGYEGVMVRNAKGYYKFNHRSPDLQKYKEFLDKEFIIIGHKVDKDGCVVWRINVAEGIECDVTPKGTKVHRRYLASRAEEFYDKLLKVKFQCYTDDGNLSFPVGIELDRTDC